MLDIVSLLTLWHLLTFMYAIIISFPRRYLSINCNGKEQTHLGASNTQAPNKNN